MKHLWAGLQVVALLAAGLAMIQGRWSDVVALTALGLASYAVGRLGDEE